MHVDGTRKPTVTSPSIRIIKLAAAMCGEKQPQPKSSGLALSSGAVTFVGLGTLDEAETSNVFPGGVWVTGFQSTWNPDEPVGLPNQVYTTEPQRRLPT